MASVHDEWRSILADEPAAVTRQLDKDVESGRLRILDIGETATCEEVQAVRTAPNRGCHRQAIAFDTTRQRHQCAGHALSHVSSRAEGFDEYPILEAGRAGLAGHETETGT